MKVFAVLLCFFTPFVWSQCVLLQQDGTLIFTADTSALCNGYWLIPATEYSAYLSSVEITVADTTSSFAWGFGVVVSLSGLAFGVSVARKVVNKL
jgi:hypothetical protein